MKQISIDPLDPASILAAEKALNDYRKWVDERTEKLLDRLATEAVYAAQIAFNDAVGEDMTPPVVLKRKTADGYLIEASGEDVVFLEFGTGALTNAHELSGNLSIEVSPGSWSRTEGIGTYEKWIESGKPLSEYPYNKPAAEGMYKAYKAIINKFSQIAREVFTA